MGKAEEYIKRNRIESMPGGHVCYMVSEEDALEAIRLAREENPEQRPSGLSGWICPKCGRPVSPFESKGFNVRERIQRMEMGCV